MLGSQYLCGELRDRKCQMAARQSFGTFHTVPVVQVVIAVVHVELFMVRFHSMFGWVAAKS